jgi:transcriptional regulator with XRE-family HTH domain
MGRKIGGSYLAPKKKSLGVNDRRAMREGMGRFINKHRLAANLDQAALSRLCGYNYNIVFKWENGEKPLLTPEDAVRLTEHLRLPEDAFAPYSQILTKRTYTKEKDPSVGHHVRQRLQELEMGQSELAKLMSLYPQHVSKIIDGTTEPTISQIKKMVGILFKPEFRNEGLNYLMYGTPLPNQPYSKQLELQVATINYLKEEIKQTSLQ